jgi:hypothetical protein
VDQHGHLQLAGLELPPLPGEPDVASQVRDTNCSAPRRAAPPSAPMSEDEVDQSDDDDDDDDGGGGGGGGGAANAADKDNETGSSGRPGRGVKRKKAGKGGKRNATPVSGGAALTGGLSVPRPSCSVAFRGCRGQEARGAGPCLLQPLATRLLLACPQRLSHAVQGMQGRFSGRLGTKEDEKRLAAECRLIGPLLGGAARGEKSLHTLAKLVRAIAAGQVRAHLEAQEAEIQVGGGGRVAGCCRVAGGRWQTTAVTAAQGAAPTPACPAADQTDSALTSHQVHAQSPCACLLQQSPCPPSL